MKQASGYTGGRRVAVTGYVGAAFAVGLLSGCQEREIGSYEIAKESVPAAAASQAGHARDHAAPAAAAEAAGPLIWVPQSHWKAKPPSAMRVASFGVPMTDGTEADLAISVLGGTAGGLTANVNRWRAQLGLPELGADEIARMAETIPASGITFTLFDLAGKANGTEARMLAAVAGFEGQTWFFKLTGHDHCIGMEKPAFAAFLRSVKTR